MSGIIPVTVFDDFFDDPHLVRDYALSLEYRKSDDNPMWPGTRTDRLDEINIEFFSMVLAKFTNIFYPYSPGPICQALMYFQLVPPEYDSGWIHRDNELISGVIYLNPKPNPDSGTTIYKKRYPYARVKNLEDKANNFIDAANGAKKLEEYSAIRREHNSQFRESVIVKNEFNRLIAFDSSELHAANSFHSDNEPRLTLVFFIAKMDALDSGVIHYPAQRPRFI